MRQYIDDDGQVESVVYLSSNEDFLKDRLLVEEGYACDIGEGVIYSTYSEKKNQNLNFKFYVYYCIKCSTTESL